MQDDALKPKRGSSRRKGDEFQDLTALRIIVELYLAGQDFRVFLEYEKAQAIDDIVVFVANDMRAVQAKYAIDPLAVYVPDDFTEEESRTYFGAYASGWRKARATHATHHLTIELLSNRGRDTSLEGIIGADGKFTAEFIEDRVRKGAKKFRAKLQKVCAFTGPDPDAQFREFLTAFHFRLRQKTREELRTFIEAELLDHQLGISDRRVFLELVEMIERHAIDLHAPITPKELDNIFQASQRRYLLPQTFPVDKTRFVEIPTFHDLLKRKIDQTAGGYIVVTGLPGSGKSTSLSECFDSLGRNPKFSVCRYFCFVNPNDISARLRVEAEALRVNLLSELNRLFPNVLNRRHDYGEHHFLEVLTTLGQELSSQQRKLVILLDGLDHAERDREVRESVLRALPPALPAGVIIVVGTQELRNWEPLALREGREANHVPIPLFSLAETERYLVEKHQLALNSTAIQQLHDKGRGLPLYLRYVATWLKQHSGDISSLDAMPQTGDGDIRSYYERLWANFEREGRSDSRYLCGVLAVLRFPIKPEELMGFQDSVAAQNFHSAMQALAHLLRNENNQISIFHDSFRVFVGNKLDGSTKHRIASGIAAKLKTEKGSGRWFAHVFHYFHEAGDDDYVIAEVNRPFVDFALQRCRPAEEITASIDAAVKAAVRKKDVVQLARLGSLHFRTHDRLENQFDYSSLAKVQLALGRIGDVLNFCCQPKERRWLVKREVADQVMIWCARTNNRDLGERLFRISLETHEHAPAPAVMGIYSREPLHYLGELSSLNL